MPIRKHYTGSLDNNILNQKELREQGISIEYPFGKSNKPFSYTYNTLETAKSKIKMLFDSKKGERLMNPEVGMALDKYQFEPINEATKLAIKKEISDNIKKYVPEVFIIKMNIDINDNNKDRNIISVSIQFSLKNEVNISDNINLEI
jgi:phage baseplate assembly protein W